MPDDFNKLLKKYNYHLPVSLIAQAPAKPRDKAKLLVYHKDNGKVSYDIFRNLTKYLPPRAVLVFNETKVIPARLVLNKPTGGQVRVLYLDTKSNLIEVLADRFIKIGMKLALDIGTKGSKPIFFVVVKQIDNHYWLKPSFALSKLPQIFELYGHTPTPPYIKHTYLSEKQLRQEYQTVFAKAAGSVAAPTAALHFTKGLLKKIKKQGFNIEFVTLHVNLGTFAPLTADQVERHKLHQEWYTIDKTMAVRLAQAKKQGRPIIAVGTTVVRTLESAANKSGKLKKLIGTTDLFISEGYKFKFVDGLITNFHVPESSLLMLVAALVGRTKLLELYKKAISKKFRFFSFGDGMVIY